MPKSTPFPVSLSGERALKDAIISPYPEGCPRLSVARDPFAKIDTRAQVGLCPRAVGTQATRTATTHSATRILIGALLLIRATGDPKRMAGVAGRRVVPIARHARVLVVGLLRVWQVTHVKTA